MKRYRTPAAASRANEKAKERKARWRSRNPGVVRANLNAFTRGRRALVQKLKSGPCSDCGNTFDPVCMDFDHRPGTVKLFAVASRTQYSIDALMAEIAKCDLVCANCHRIRTHRLRDHAKTCQRIPQADAPAPAPTPPPQLRLIEED